MYLIERGNKKMPWDDENELDNGYTKRDIEYFDREVFFRQNQNMIMELDREWLSLINRINKYEEKLLETPKNTEIGEYLKRLYKQKNKCEKTLYYFEDEVSGYSNRY